MCNIQYLTSARARVRGQGLGLGQGYPTSEMCIGRPIYILDVRYIYWTSDIYIGHLISISEILVSICLKWRLIVYGHFSCASAC